MSRISYIASSGGLLGLCMGFSFVSLAEILYHCFLCVLMVIRHESSKLVRKDLWKNKSRNTATNENGHEKDKGYSEHQFVPPKHTLLWSYWILTKYGSKTLLTSHEYFSNKQSYTFSTFLCWWHVYGWMCDNQWQKQKVILETP